MAEKVASLYAEIKLEKANLEKGLKDSKASLKDTEKALKSTEKTTSDLGKSLGLFALAGAAVLGKFALDAVKKASDLNETLSKTKIVLGDASGAVLAYAKDTAASFGLSQQAALDAASTFGIFGKSAGLTGGALADFSLDLTKLSADIASFNNATPEEVIVALGAALRGEAEPMRRFGVLLDDATLRNKALEMGIISSIKNALTPQQRVLAANAVIMEQTKDAQGDFARTSDGLANQTRILNAEWENLTVALGTGFLPVAIKAISALGELTKKANQNMDATAALKRAMDQGVVTWDETNMGTIKAADALDLVEDRMRAVEAATTNSMPPLSAHHDLLLKNTIKANELASSLGGLETATDSVAAAYQRSIGPTDDFAESNSRVAVSIGEVTKASLGKDALDALTKAYEEGTISEAEYDKQARFIMGSLLGMPIASIVAQETLQDLKGDLDDGKITAQEYAKALFDMGINLDNLNGKKAYVDVYTTFHEQKVTSPGSTGGSGTGSGTFAPGSGGAQHGADFIVPQGYPHDTYNLPVSSGEHVKVTPANEIGTSQPIVINVNGSVTNDNIHALARAVGAELQRQARYN